MLLTEEARIAILAHSLPRWRVRRSEYGFWVVWCGKTKVAVFFSWRDAIAFARWKATA